MDANSVPITPLNPSINPRPIHPTPTPIIKPMSFNDMVQMQLLTKAKEVMDQGKEGKKEKSLMPKYLQDMAMAASNLDDSDAKLQDFMKGVAANCYMMKSLDAALQSISNFPAMKAYLNSLSKEYCGNSPGVALNTFGSASVDFSGLLSKANAFTPNGNDDQKESEMNSEVSIIQSGSTAVGSGGQAGITLQNEYINNEGNEDGSYSGIGQVIATMTEGSCLTPKS